METSQNDRDEFLRTEYKALVEYFGKIITFRFTTVSFFLAAVAFVLGRANPEWHHYLLLLAFSLGVWIVELRNRSLSGNLVCRAKEIELRWANNEKPFFTHMIPPKGVWYPDRAQMLWFLLPSMRFITHTVGLDVVYLSVIAYSGWGMFSTVKAFPQGTLTMNVMDPVAAVLALGLTLVGANLIKTAATGNQTVGTANQTAAPEGTVVRRPCPLIGVGWALLGAAAVIVVFALWRTA
jgi:hypothetical protein